MTWGSTGSWGLDAWGTGVAGPVPTLIAAAPTLVARRGGDVISLFGTGFSRPILIEVLQGGLVVDTCYAFEADTRNDRDDGDINLFALTRTRVFAGTPALEDGVYDLRVTTAGGVSGILSGALTYELFADEVKVHHVRQKLARKWKTGRRLLTTSQALR